MKQRLRRWGILTTLLVGAALIYSLLDGRQEPLAHFARQLGRHLEEQDRNLRADMADPDLFIRLFRQYQRTYAIPEAGEMAQLRRWEQRLYSLFLHAGKELVFWSGNETDLPVSLLQPADGPDRLVELSNGFYLLRQRWILDGPDSLLLSGIIPVRKDYPLESPYLRSGFTYGKGIPKILEIVSTGGMPVYGLDGQYLFGLIAPEPLKAPPGRQLIFLILCLLASGSLAMLLHAAANALSNRYHPMLGASFLLITVVGIRALTLLLDASSRFSSLEVFSRAFSGNLLNQSVGDFLINSILLLWLMIYFFRSFQLPSHLQWAPSLRFAFTVSAVLLVALGLIVLTRLLQSLVLDAVIDFDFDNIFNLTAVRLLALSCAVMLVLSFFLFSSRLMLTVKALGAARNTRLAALSLVLLLSAPLIRLAGLDLPVPYVLLMILIYILCFDIYLDSRLASLTWLIVFLSLFAIYSAVVLYTFHLRKDLNARLQYAQILAQPRDSVAEPGIALLALEIMNDSVLQQYFTTPLPFTVRPEKIRERIDPYFLENNYLFNNYEYDIFILNLQFEQSMIEGQRPEGILQLIGEQKDALPTPYENLYYWADPTYSYTYLYQRTVATLANPDNPYSVMLGLRFRIRDASRVYSELLLRAGYRGIEQLDQYDFSIYRGAIPVVTHGKVPASELRRSEGLKPGQWTELFSSFRSVLIYHGPGDTVVYLGKDLGGVTKLISLFSFLFVLFLLVSLLGSALSYFTGALPSSLEIPFLGRSSLPHRIQSTIFLLTIFSFGLIGLVTAHFFRQSSLKNHEENLRNKARAVLEDIRHDIELVSRSGGGAVDLGQIIGPVAEIHNMEINIFDLRGKLKTSSAAFVFSQGIAAPRMNALALQQLRQPTQTAAIIQEKIGDLQYESAYVPVRDEKEEIIAYLGLPYYGNDRDQRENLFAFLGTLLNTYVFLLLIASGIAFLVANSITRPITQIGEKLSRLKLGRNEPLEWKNQEDEIGQLIVEYNRMIAKLEESAEKLRQSEREGAWREMAKQVAHEIKNPLTPMKLQIQHLLRVYHNDPAQAASMLEKVSRSIIEQIDGLSQIASDFSNFAKMPQARNERFVLNDLLSSVYQLFAEDQDSPVKLHLSTLAEPVEILADKSHIMRVLNNLVKNAIQSIPDQRKGEVNISMDRKNGMAVVRVRDNGSGIEENLRDKVFYPNFTTKNSGMGLGLAISKSIIDAAGGRIYFETRTGEGTSFFVELPLLEEKPPAE